MLGFDVLRRRILDRCFPTEVDSEVSKAVDENQGGGEFVEVANAGKIVGDQLDDADADVGEVEGGEETGKEDEEGFEEFHRAGNFMAAMDKLWLRL
jgi:hypothetical protein